jgi:acetyl esterase/lipase
MADPFSSVDRAFVLSWLTMTPTTYEYAELPGFRPLELDVWAPQPTAEPARIIVWIHGGAWLSGARGRLPDTFPGLFSQCTEAGFAVLALDYRLSAEALFPAQLDDVAAGLRWVVEHAAEIGADADRLAVWGESAGGHLAALLALTTPPGLVKCAVPMYPPTDLETMRKQSLATAKDPSIYPPIAESPEALLIGGPPDEVPERARAASPISYVHAGAPPMLLLHGTEDRVVPYAQSVEFAARLAELGVDVTLAPVPGADHVFAGDPNPPRLIADALDFTARCMTKPDRD